MKERGDEVMGDGDDVGVRFWMWERGLDVEVRWINIIIHQYIYISIIFKGYGTLYWAIPLFNRTP